MAIIHCGHGIGSAAWGMCNVLGLCHERQSWSPWGLEALESRQIKASIKDIYICIYYATGLLRAAHEERGWSCATVTMRPRWLWWWTGGEGGPDYVPTYVAVQVLDYRLFRWLTEMGRQVREDRGRIGRPIAPWCAGCTVRARALRCCTWEFGVHKAPSAQVGKYHVVGCHVGCHVMVAAGRGENPYQIREKRGSVSRLGPVSGVRTGAAPLSAVLRLRNALARPSSVFITARPLGRGIHQCRGPAQPVARQI